MKRFLFWVAFIATLLFTRNVYAASLTELSPDQIEELNYNNGIHLTRNDLFEKAVDAILAGSAAIKRDFYIPIRNMLKDNAAFLSGLILSDDYQVLTISPASMQLLRDQVEEIMYTRAPSHPVGWEPCNISGVYEGSVGYYFFLGSDRYDIWFNDPTSVSDLYYTIVRDTSSSGGASFFFCYKSNSPNNMSASFYMAKNGSFFSGGTVSWTNHLPEASGGYQPGYWCTNIGNVNAQYSFTSRVLAVQAFFGPWPSGDPILSGDVFLSDELPTVFVRSIPYSRWDDLNNRNYNIIADSYYSDGVEYPNTVIKDSYRDPSTDLHPEPIYAWYKVKWPQGSAVDNIDDPEIESLDYDLPELDSSFSDSFFAGLDNFYIVLISLGAVFLVVKILF